MSLRTTILSLLGVLALSACEVEKTQDGELPDVKVEGGHLPKYEIKRHESPDLELRLDTTQIVVPKIGVDTSARGHRKPNR